MEYESYLYKNHCIQLCNYNYVKALTTYLPNKIVFGKNDSIPNIINLN